MTQWPGLTLKITLMQLPKINSSTLMVDNNNTSSLANGYDSTFSIVKCLIWEFVVPRTAICFKMTAMYLIMTSQQ